MGAWRWQLLNLLLSAQSLGVWVDLERCLHITTSGCANRRALVQVLGRWVLHLLVHALFVALLEVSIHFLKQMNGVVSHRAEVLQLVAEQMLQVGVERCNVLRLFL